ncbi:single-stranded-DNA-specific exonuclease RecJ [Sulfitobacter sp. R18_1]|uniref:single-stranded-DNA-specific exonuclease RecJ n=1 Tax=Sulfitobacter sp. R18_1 TaxID=2821104 RepID=UPI001ADC49AC|nr:single-stranded-DNA-specific exonuclease RecJ [Sulfitobacter sp. R18_1]MBO9428405.1 single-stranded-DNA-specific exonuclease RecJ [Sulfitobacter sp. R18_1]
MSNKSIRGLEWTVPETKDISVPGVPPEVVQVAAARGITDFKEFFKPTLAGSMPDPLVLKDMDKAIERVRQGVLNKEKVCVFGDYDVDGATSTSMMVLFLRDLGLEVDFYIPDREKEGYGPNTPAIEKIAAKGTELLIVVDSGTLAFEPMKRAAELGMGVVILDHHTAKDEHPEGILVNPNRNDESGEYYYLCAAGLVFLFLCGLRRDLREQGIYENREEYDMRPLLGIAALGTVADVMDLVGTNRAYVKLGIPWMTENIGLMALAEACEVDPKDFNEKTCGFVFGPCINASGRIDDTSRGTRLLISQDPEEAAVIARELVEINNERKALQKSFQEAAYEQANQQKDTNVIVVYDESWHPGVVGIVASRIKDKFDKSAIVIGKGGKGSCRGVDGFNIGAAVIAAVEEGVLIGGGGHAPAAGLTLDPSKLEELREFMRERGRDLERPPLEADLEISCGAMSLGVLESFNMLKPFGKGNSEPRVIVTGGVFNDAKKLKNEHVKGKLTGAEGMIDVILFNCVGTPLGDALLSADGHQVDLYGKLDINEYLGEKKLQMKNPEDLRMSDNDLELI